MTENLPSNYNSLLDELEIQVIQKSSTVKTQEQFRSRAEGMELTEIVKELEFWRDRPIPEADDDIYTKAKLETANRLLSKLPTDTIDPEEDLFDQFEQELDFQIDESGHIRPWRINESNQDTLKDELIVAYHGTSSNLIDSISDKGLMPGIKRSDMHHTNSQAGVYVTLEDQGPAMDGYLRNATIQHGGEPALLEVLVPVSGLTPDYDDEDLASGSYQYTTPFIQPASILNLDEYIEDKPLLSETGEKTWMEGNIYSVSIHKDEFIHFTTRDRAESIINDGRLLMDPPHEKFGTDTVNAISTNWGNYVPNVQDKHYGDQDLVAVKFQTNTLPDYGYVEEVVWKQDVVFERSEIISRDEAIELLNKSPFTLSGDDEIRFSTDRADNSMDTNPELSI